MPRPTQSSSFAGTQAPHKCDIDVVEIRRQSNTVTASSHTTWNTRLTIATVASSGIFESVYTGLANLTTLIPQSTNLSAAVAHASKAIEAIFTSNLQSPPPTVAATWQDQLIHQITNLTDFLATRTALENTSILLAFCTFLSILAGSMSWGTRLGNLGRFSPFTRSPPQGSTKVSDADFSYITADDLRKHQAGSSHHHQQPAESPVDYGPARDTDMLLLKNKKRDYPVHFPAYSIANGSLTIGQVRDHAAKKTGTADARRVKLLFRGKNLKDDTRTCKSEGLREGDQLMLSIADTVLASASGSSDGSDDDEEDQQTAGGDGETSRRRRNRGKKSKRKAKRDLNSGTSTPLSEQQTQAPPANLGVPVSQPSTRAPSPRPTPTTAMDKLDTLRQKLGEFLPQAAAFIQSPPADPAKKNFEHKRISETILAQVLLKLDAVETEGDPEARQKRKDLVRETQRVLTDLDTAVKA